MTSPSSRSAVTAGVAGNKSNSQVIESVPLALIKLPVRSVKPPSPEAVALCKGNLDRYGQPRPVIVTDDNTAHECPEFVLAARELGWTHINVVRLSGLSEADLKVHMLWLAKLPYLSDWDEQALRFEFEEIISLDPDLVDFTGFTMGEIDVIFDPDTTTVEADPLDGLPEIPLAGEVISRPGDLFLLDDHRILCGNSQKPENFDRLIGQERARAAITDPPWNTPVENNVSGRGKIKHGDFAMGVGEMSLEKFTEFLVTMFVLISKGLLSGALIYVFMDRRHLEELFAAARKAKLRIFDVGIWDKLTGGLGGMYRSQFEACGIFKLGDGVHLNNVELGKYGRYRTNVWKHRGLSSFGKGRSEALAMHPTVKPVNLLAEIIKDCSKRGEIVIDPFLGSGSSVLASQKTGRRCFGIELEGMYIDVAIRRWENMTGNWAVHADSGLTFAELGAQRRAENSSAAAYPNAGDNHDK